MEHPKLALLLPWEDIDFNAQNQIIRVLAQPELVKLAIMPDVHGGYDLCIGGVALLQGVVSPSFVGYDIGCGMCHVNTGKTLEELKLSSRSAREKLFASMQLAIPAGVGQVSKEVDPVRKGMIEDSYFRAAGLDVGGLSAQEKKMLERLKTVVNNTIPQQLGTLGGGNHFLEVGANQQGIVGVTIHSGSRRCGYDIASFYMRQHRFLSVFSPLGQAYLEDMNWALDFALRNRRYMLLCALRCLGFRRHEVEKIMNGPSFINETHNHAVPQPENATQLLHRKGATPAALGQLGVIPANQRDGVYITRGLGNEAFLSSASHGAGRKYSRVAAKQAGSLKQLKALMADVVCRTDAKVLDEAPWAYKPIKGVLERQEGVVVTVQDHFKPIVVLKG